MFEEMANEIFAKAKVDPAKNANFYKQCVDILSSSMAMHSALYGLSYKRVTSYNKQKASLVKDLKKLKADGAISE